MGLWSCSLHADEEICEQLEEPVKWSRHYDSTLNSEQKFPFVLLPQNHRAAWVGRNLKGHLVSTLCHKQGCQPLNQAPAQAAQGPMEPGPECLQGWGSHRFPGQPVPVPHLSLTVCFSNQSGRVGKENHCLWPLVEESTCLCTHTHRPSHLCTLWRKCFCS